MDHNCILNYCEYFRGPDIKLYERKLKHSVHLFLAIVYIQIRKNYRLLSHLLMTYYIYSGIYIRHNLKNTNMFILYYLYLVYIVLQFCFLYTKSSLSSSLLLKFCLQIPYIHVRD